MKRIVYTCDKCGKEISHVAYSLVCYAEDVSAQSGGGISEEAAAQNIKQNMELGTFENKTEKILCKECKDEITDGVFIV